MQRATLLALRRAPLTAATASSSIIAPMRPAVAVCARTGGLPMRAAPRRQVIAMMPTMQLQRSFASTASSGNSSAPKPAEAANSGSSSSSAGAGSDGSSGSSGGQQQSNSSGSSSSSSGGGGYFRSDSWTKTVGTIGAIANWTIPLAGITHMINAKDPATTIDPVMTSALAVYSVFFMRWALAITPANYPLLICHVSNEVVQLAQLGRYINAVYVNPSSPPASAAAAAAGTTTVAKV